MTISKNFNTNMQMPQHVSTSKVTSPRCKGKPQCNWPELKFANPQRADPKGLHREAKFFTPLAWKVPFSRGDQTSL